MLADFGYGILILTFLLALFSIAAAVIGSLKQSAAWVESARRAVLLTFPLISLAAIALLGLLINNHFEIAYVYSVTSREMPMYLKLTAWWGGQAGSLLFWGWLLSAFTSAVTLRKWDRDREFLPWVIVVTAITLAFFLSLVIFFENPFWRWYSFPGLQDPIRSMIQPAGAQLIQPGDGRGLNPLLRHPGMIIHPPMLYLGFVSFVVPYAFAIAALVTGRSDDRWIRVTRRWTLWAWMFLSVGLVLGSRWAYDVLGWGGYWAWDPVEVAAFLPWLVGTAFLHSVIIQERRGQLKQWNMFLIIGTYSAAIYGTFLTRSGLFSSVHSFAQSAIGPAFLTFIGVMFIGSMALVVWRWKDLQSETEMTSWLSREALFLLNNFLFVAVFLICFWNIHMPMFSELLYNQKLTIGPVVYKRETVPFFGTIMALMAVAPLSAWGKSTWKTLGRAIWKPAAVALLVPIVLVVIGTRNPVALTGFFLVALVILVTLYDTWHAARARQKAHNEDIPHALGQLVTRNRRRYGGYIVHISVMLMAIGILGIELFQVQTQKSLAIGESIQIHGYTVRYDSLAQFPYEDGRMVTRTVVSVFDRDGKFLQELYPRYDVYPSGEPATIAGVRSTLAGDLYVVLVNWEGTSTTTAPFKIYYNPLISWLWIGSILLIIGQLVAAWPDRDPEAVAIAATSKKEVRQTSSAD
jgi:cytochrome c-type biogenesis protein CcmF